MFEDNAKKFIDSQVEEAKKPGKAPENKLMSVKSVRDAVVDDTLKGTKVNKDVVKKAMDKHYEQPKPSIDPKKLSTMDTATDIEKEVFKTPITKENAKQVAGKTSQFKPTKETIWNDPKHPLYGIGPSEQNSEFLKSAIKELERNTQSPAHFKFYAGSSGSTMAESKKKLAQYKKALDYIQNYKGESQPQKTEKYTPDQRQATYYAEDEVGVKEYRNKEDVTKVANWLVQNGYAKDTEDAIGLIKSEMLDPNKIDLAMSSDGNFVDKLLGFRASDIKPENAKKYLNKFIDLDNIDSVDDMNEGEVFTVHMKDGSWIMLDNRYNLIDYSDDYKQKWSNSPAQSEADKWEEADNLAGSVESLLQEYGIPHPSIDYQVDSVDVNAKNDYEFYRIKQILNKQGIEFEDISGGGFGYRGVRIPVQSKAQPQEQQPKTNGQQNFLQRDWEELQKNPMADARWSDAYAKEVREYGKAQKQKQLERELNPEYQEQKAKLLDVHTKLGQAGLGLSVADINDIVNYIKTKIR